MAGTTGVRIALWIGAGFAVYMHTMVSLVRVVTAEEEWSIWTMVFSVRGADLAEFASLRTHQFIEVEAERDRLSWGFVLLSLCLFGGWFVPRARSALGIVAVIGVGAIYVRFASLGGRTPLWGVPDALLGPVLVPIFAVVPISAEHVSENILRGASIGFFLYMALPLMIMHLRSQRRRAEREGMHSGDDDEARVAGAR